MTSKSDKHYTNKWLLKKGEREKQKAGKRSLSEGEGEVGEGSFLQINVLPSHVLYPKQIKIKN